MAGRGQLDESSRRNEAYRAQVEAGIGGGEGILLPEKGVERDGVELGDGRGLSGQHHFDYIGQCRETSRIPFGFSLEYAKHD